MPGSPDPDHHRNHDPSSQPTDPYRVQVQTRTQDLLSGRRPRDPHLSSVSTTRLILEAVVEEAKIYRLHKEEKVREAKEKESRRKRREKRRMNRSKDGEPEERHQHLRRHEGSDRPEGEHGRRTHHHREEVRDGEPATERHGHRRHRSRSGSHEQLLQQRDSHDQSQSHHSDSNPPEDPYLMSGGAGPTGTLPPPSNNSSPTPRPRSPTRRATGPDGVTPLGQLPKKLAGVGLGAHFMNTYRHIKAEHEAGHRSRGALEKHVDKLRGKGGGVKLDGGGKRNEAEKVREGGRRDNGRRKHGDRSRGDDDRSRDSGRRRAERGEREEGRAHRNAANHDDPRNGAQNRYEVPSSGDGRPRNVAGASIRGGHYEEKRLGTPRPPETPRRPPTPYRPRHDSPAQSSQERPPDPLVYVHPPSPSHNAHADVHFASNEQVRHEDVSDDELYRAPTPRRKSGPSPSVHVRAPSPTYSAPSSRATLRLRSSVRTRSPSPPYPPSINDRSAPPTPPLAMPQPQISPFLRPPSPVIAPAPPPPPPPPPAANAMRNCPKIPPGLVAEIAGGAKLRKVLVEYKKDKSTATTGGRVLNPEYEATPHSQIVEEQERGQASTRTWSDAGIEEVGGPDRDFQGKLAADLMKQWAGAGEGNGRLSPAPSSHADGLTKDPRTRLNEVQASLWEGSSCNEDGVLDNVSRFAGTPSWDWGNLGGRREE